MNLFEYIKSQLPHLPNPAIMKNMGASEELIGYVRKTVWNTNLGMMKTLGCEAGGGGSDDCNHPELGTLIYCGSASNKTIVSNGGDGCDEGIQEGFCDMFVWDEMLGKVAEGGENLHGVFDGNVAVAEFVAENEIAFGDYLFMFIATDAETGYKIIVVSELTGASHYAIYYNPE